MRPGEQAAQRTDVYDASTVSIDHAARGLLAAKEGRFEIDGVDEIPVLLGEFQRIDGRESGGVVNEGVDRAYLFKHPLDLGNVFEIRPDEARAAAFFGGRPGFGFGSVVVDDDSGAFFSEPKRDPAADAFGSSGDQDDASVERSHSVLFESRSCHSSLPDDAQQRSAPDRVVERYGDRNGSRARFLLHNSVASALPDGRKPMFLKNATNFIAGQPAAYPTGTSTWVTKISV